MPVGPVVKKLGGFLLAWLPVLLWMALILAMSSRSDLPIRTNPQTGETIKTTFTLAKLAHVFEYGVLGLLLLRALTRRPGGLMLRLTPGVVVTVLAAAVFGALDELRQSLVPNREPRLTDVALDTASALAACICVSLYIRLRRPALLPRSEPERGLGGEVSPKASS